MGEWTQKIGRRAPEWCFYTRKPFNQQRDLKSEESVHYLGCWIILLKILGFCATREKSPNLLKVAATKWNKGGCIWWHAGKTAENYSFLQGWDLQNPAWDQESRLFRAYSSAVLCRNFLGVFPISFYTEKNQIYLWKHSNSACNVSDILHAESSFSAGLLP